MLGVIVQPGGMVGSAGKSVHAVIAAASQSPGRMRMYFIRFLYWQKIKSSSEVVFEFCVIYNRSQKFKLKKEEK
jgi:hypothetical protein